MTGTLFAEIKNRKSKIKNRNAITSCDLFDPSPRFHGGSFGVWGHTSCEALEL